MNHIPPADPNPNLYDLSLNVVNNPDMPVLLLQFAAEHDGDPAEARLARQIPRFLGRKLNLSGRFQAKFLPFRDNAEDGAAYFINTTALPERDAVAEIAAFHKIRYVLYGKIGVAGQIRMEVFLYDASARTTLFRKGFDTYPTYMFDAFDQICAEIAKAAGLDLSRDERLALFSRDTLNWDALLYYLMAEDERYAMLSGVAVPDIAGTVRIFAQALATDPEFRLAESAATETVLEALNRQALEDPDAVSLLNSLLESHPALTLPRRVLMLLALSSGDNTAVRHQAGQLLRLHPGDEELHTEIRQVLDALDSDDDAPA